MRTAGHGCIQVCRQDTKWRKCFSVLHKVSSTACYISFCAIRPAGGPLASDRLPKEMRDGLDQHTIKPSLEVIGVSQSATAANEC